ncbi:opsin 9 [Scomber scombrus]|uniref:opsin 9 n=1 Tax=Scomber scombrus TaxID=13677 RepID=UPI002DDB4818|nr:opsin 9 [Scomber scombrus]
MGENGSQRSSWFVPSSIHPLFLSQLSPSADLAVAVFLILAGVISVLGNGLVLWVHCRKRKKLRLHELMTVNLALCDFGSSLLGVPFFIISSLCHAWVFGETGCLWYGIQGFVFGIGSLLTTCLISLDRCLKICCLRYGQWIERHHVSLSIALMWVYTFFWASLPAFGFGSYGPEPYGTSCTINWWAMRSSLIDRIYIFLILTLCFGLPTLAIITSYLAILLTVYRSNRTLASIPSSSVSHTSKDLRLAKMAAVVCGTFLLAWMPYATVSLISALIPSDEQDAEGTLQTVVEFSGTASTQILDFPSLVNWTTTEYYRQIYYNPREEGSEVSNLGEKTNPIPRSSQPFSCLPHVVTLIPAMFAKSHCMINPLIYQIMNLEFRDNVYEMLFGREKAERRRLQGRHGSYCESKNHKGSISLSYCQSWKRKRSSPTSLLVDKRNLQEEKNQGRSNGGRIGCWADNISVGSDALDITSLDTQRNMERQCSTGGQEERRRNLRGSSIVTV